MTNPNNPGTYREMPYSPMVQQPAPGTPMQRPQPGTMAPGMPPMTTMPPMPTMPQVPGEQTPTTLSSPYYLAGYLRNFIGRVMRVEFMLGTNGALTDRTGTLQEVGVSYIVLTTYPNNVKVICDLYSIKFVTVYN